MAKSNQNKQPAKQNDCKCSEQKNVKSRNSKKAGVATDAPSDCKNCK